MARELVCSGGFNYIPIQSLLPSCPPHNIAQFDSYITKLNRWMQKNLIDNKAAHEVDFKYNEVEQIACFKYLISPFDYPIKFLVGSVFFDQYSDPMEEFIHSLENGNNNLDKFNEVLPKRPFLPESLPNHFYYSLYESPKPYLESNIEGEIILRIFEDIGDIIIVPERVKIVNRFFCDSIGWFEVSPILMIREFGIGIVLGNFTMSLYNKLGIDRLEGFFTRYIETIQRGITFWNIYLREVIL